MLLPSPTPSMLETVTVLSLFTVFSSPYNNVVDIKYPSSPDTKMHILRTVLHTFLIELEKRIILSKGQDILSLVITFYILIIGLFEQIVIM